MGRLLTTNSSKASPSGLRLGAPTTAACSPNSNCAPVSSRIFRPSAVELIALVHRLVRPRVSRERLSLLRLRRNEGGNDLRVGSIPNSQHAVLPAGHNDFPVRSDGGRIDVVAGAVELADLLPILADRPHLAIAGADHSLVHAADVSNGRHLFAEVLQRTVGGRFLPFARHEVPDLDRVVRAATGQGAPVLLPTYSEHMVRVPFE